jgi:hypothetical protein
VRYLSASKYARVRICRACVFATTPAEPGRRGLVVAVHSERGSTHVFVAYALRLWQQVSREFVGVYVLPLDDH